MFNFSKVASKIQRRPTVEKLKSNMLQDWIKSKNPDLFCIALHSIYWCWNQYKLKNSRVLNIRDQPAFLAQTPYSSLPQQTLKKMVMDPKGGISTDIVSSLNNGSNYVAKIGNAN